MEKQVLQSLVGNMLASYDNHPETVNIGEKSRLDREIIIDILLKIRSILFPGYFEQKQLKSTYIEYHVGELMEDIQYKLNKQIVKALHHTEDKQPVKEDAGAALSSTSSNLLADIRQRGHLSGGVGPSWT